MLDDYFVNLVLSVIKKTTLLSIAPIKARLFSGNTNITQTVFGVDSIPLNTLTKFSGTDNIINSQNGSNITTVVLSNANPISIGVALSSYYGVVEFRILDKDNKIINSKEQFIAIEQGATYRIPSRFLEIGISNATQILENFLLDYLVSSSPNTIYNSPTSTANNDPTKWKLVGGGTEIRAIQKSLFGLLEQNIIGQLELKYGEAWVFISQNLLSFSDLKILRSNEQNNSTLPWFQLKSAVTTQFFAPEQRIEFYNNSLAWVYEPEIIKIDTVILPEDPNSLVSIGFDGTLEDFSRTVIERSYEAVYSGDHKLFKTQSILFNTNNILYYDNFVLPQVFTLQFFVRFDISPASRNIVFFEKLDVIKLEKVATDIRLKLFNNTFSFPFTPDNQTWYHIFITRNGVDINFRINTIINSSVTLSSNFTDNSTEPLMFNDENKVIYGFVNGFHLSSDIKTFELYKEPLPKYQYNWHYTPGYAWFSPYFRYAHWIKLLKAGT